jgi:hypothetical protein
MASDPVLITDRREHRDRPMEWGPDRLPRFRRLAPDRQREAEAQEAAREVRERDELPAELDAIHDVANDGVPGHRIDPLGDRLAPDPAPAAGTGLMASRFAGRAGTAELAPEAEGAALPRKDAERLAEGRRIRVHDLCRPS